MRKGLKDVLILGLLLALILIFYWKIAFSGRILASYDLFTYYYPYKAYMASLKWGQWPLWNPYLFMGFPLLANIQPGFFYPFNFITRSMDPPQAVNLSVLVHIFLAGAFTYILTRVTLGLDRLSATMSAMVFMFSGHISAQVGHINRLNSFVWMPLLFVAMDLAYRKRHPAWVLGGSLVMGLLLVGHPQESFITLLGLGLFALYLGLRGEASASAHVSQGVSQRPSILKRLIRAGAILLAMTIIGAGIAALQLLPTMELSTQSIRSGGLPYGEASSFSLPPQEILRSLLPTFVKPPFSEYVAYIGIFPIALVLVAFRKRPHNSYTPFCLLLAVVGFILALGGYTPLYPVLYRILPGIDLFRVPARWLYLYTFAMALAAGIGLNTLTQGRGITTKARAHKRVIFPILAVLFWGGFELARLNILIPPGFVLGLWGGMGLLALALTSWSASKIPPTLLASILLALVGLELFFAGRDLEFNHPVPPQAYSSLRPAVAQLLTDQGNYRILSLASSDFEPGDKAELQAIFGDNLSSTDIDFFIASAKYKEVLASNLPLRYQIATIDGYDVLPLQRYVEFKKLLFDSGGVASGADPNQPDGLLRLQLRNIPDSRVLGALSVKYIITDKTNDPWVDNVYYDLASTVVVGRNNPAYLDSLPSFEATAIGIISHLAQGSGLLQGQPIARVSVRDQEGKIITTTLRAGIDTAEGENQELGNQRQPRIVSQDKGEPQIHNFYTRVELGKATYPREIKVEYLAPQGELSLRGLSLIDGRTQAAEALTLNPRLKLVHSGDVKIYENLDWMPRAYLVHDWKLATTLDDTLDILKGDFRNRVVLTESPKDMNGRPSVATKDRVETTKDEPDKINISAQLARPGFLVLTDAYYPGWKAWVDGSPAPIYRAQYLFRALYLAPGQHEIEFRYEPASWRWGWLITRLTLALVIGLLGLMALKAILGRRAKD
ncbi:MAG: YfhO family protein [Chloroflexi bacterium]|nr:YfhO family protein [Chloroflexota bacterium]